MILVFLYSFLPPFPSSFLFFDMFWAFYFGLKNLSCWGILVLLPLCFFLCSYFFFFFGMEHLAAGGSAKFPSKKTRTQKRDHGVWESSGNDQIWERKDKKRERCTVRREEEPSSELMNVDSSSYEVAAFLKRTAYQSWWNGYIGCFDPNSVAVFICAWYYLPISQEWGNTLKPHGNLYFQS